MGTSSRITNGVANLRRGHRGPMRKRDGLRRATQEGLAIWFTSEILRFAQDDRPLYRSELAENEDGHGGAVPLPSFCWTLALSGAA
jgi:hypothetical protein